MNNDALIIDDLHHKYDKQEYSNWILKEINLKIESGELLGLLGPSGCGKTTLLRLIAGFEYPSKGKIFLNSKEISSSYRILSPEKRNIGMVFQDYALFPHLTVFENVMFGLKNKNNRSRADYLLNVVGLDSFVGRYPHELSGGQKQRLAIARALAPGTNFILLDEPFCSLDMHVKLKLRSELPNILRGCNASGLMVTHDPEEAMSICDKVAVMFEGEIHQIDTPINLLNNPKTIFVSSFILGNNILNLHKNGNSYMSCLGEINSPKLSNNTNIKSISIAPKSISIKRSNSGKAIVLSKEFLGEFLMYKVSINDEILRVRTNIDNQLNNGEKCSLSINKDSYCFLYPGAQKVYI
ncbi:ABC transporter ATP-binding protein [uncultured Prochlorococcus sp.]|uniref:ABC transporter ATP-binding protein n=1 Tax=uncultured Prochlorococcus sp. TaxID=159733 RepID=UPI00258E3019|nr:ABC transporter ATP-binding protein [uncultured Prochlorococcus sp.]